MSEHPTIRRSRELLESTDRLLDEVRNRPRYSSSFLDAQPERRTVKAPVVRKVRQDARVERTIAASTQAAWDRWANGIAAKVAGRLTLVAVDKILDASKTALAARDRRIGQLDQRIAQLEQRLTDEVIEWPIKSRSVA